MSKRSSGRINDEYYMANELLDNKIFEDLFELHFTKLMGFVYNYDREEEVAMDIVHNDHATLVSEKNVMFMFSVNCLS